MSLKTHGDSPQEENAFSFVKLGNMTPAPPTTVKAATGNTARSPSFQPSFSSVSPPFKQVEVPAARALLSLVGGGQVNREGATAQRTRD